MMWCRRLRRRSQRRHINNLDVVEEALGESMARRVDAIFHTASIAFGTSFMPTRSRRSGIH